MIERINGGAKLEAIVGPPAPRKAAHGGAAPSSAQRRYRRSVGDRLVADIVDYDDEDGILSEPLPKPAALPSTSDTAELRAFRNRWQSYESHLVTLLTS